MSSILICIGILAMIHGHVFAGWFICLAGLSW